MCIYCNHYLFIFSGTSGILSSESVNTTWKSAQLSCITVSQISVRPGF